MKKIIYIILSVSILFNVFFLAQPSNLVHAASAEKDINSDRILYYTGNWNQCLTDAIDFYNDQLPEGETTTSICEGQLKKSFDNKFYEYRNSDMFDPLPRSIIPMYKPVINSNVITFDATTAKKYNKQGYIGFVFTMDDGSKLLLELKNPQNKPGMIVCKGDFDTKNYLNKLFPELGC